MYIYIRITSSFSQGENGELLAAVRRRVRQLNNMHLLLHVATSVVCTTWENSKIKKNPIQKK